MPGTPRIDRRSILQSGGAAAAYALGISQLGATAVAQNAETELRGVAHHRFSLGSREVIVLSDGHLVVPTNMLAGNVLQTEVKSFLAAKALGPDRVFFHINVALVKVGSDYVLIDAGSGGTWEPTAGKLADSLEAAGIKPRADCQGGADPRASRPHLGTDRRIGRQPEIPAGSVSGCGKRIRFLDLGEAAKLRGPVEGIAAGARRVFKAIEARATRIRPGGEVAPGIVAIDTAGHTPGHISLLIRLPLPQAAHRCRCRAKRRTSHWRIRTGSRARIWMVRKLPKAGGKCSTWRPPTSFR